MTSNYQPVYSPRFEVTVGGSTYREAGGRIADLVVETTLDGADRVSFTMNFPFDPEYGDFSGMDWGSFEPGTEVDVAMGWGGSGKLEPLFLGQVYSASVDFSPDRGPTASASGYGTLYPTMRGTHTRSWEDATLGNVVDEVLSEYYDANDRTVEGADLKREKLIQHNQSDYRFLKDLADKYGYRFYSVRDEVRFTPRSSLDSDDPAATLRYGEALSSFSAEVNESNAVDAVEVRYWDMDENAEVVGSASTDAGTGEKEVFRVPCRSRDEADRIAEHRLNTLSSTSATGHVEADGVPEITAGTTVDLREVGSRFSGQYHVTKAVHRMGGSGYRTSLEVREVPE